VTSPGGPADPGAGLTVKQAARHLGVHYMTAYRYIRQGRLPAERAGTAWRVRLGDLEAFVGEGSAGAPPAGVDWAGRVRGPLAAGDEVAAWAVVEAALAAGVAPPEVCTAVVRPAVAAAGTGGEADGHLAAAAACRLVARLGARFRPRGPARGTVVVAGPEGEHDALALAVLTNVVRWRRFAALELGTDVPAAAVLAAAAAADRGAAVALSLTRPAALGAAADARRELVRAGAPPTVVVGARAGAGGEPVAPVGPAEWAAGRARLAALLA